MKLLQVSQGSDEWLAIRGKYHTASEASVMMGCSKLASRNDLLRMKATGDEQQFSRWVEEVLFANGHEVEALARPMAEQIIGAELYPATATDDEGYLLASYDGITLMEDVVFECKQWNEAKAEEVRKGLVPAEDFWQCVQQLAVSGAEKLLFMVTDGTEDRRVYCWLTPEPADIQQLYAGWKQFDKDLASYEPAPEAVVVEGRAPETLPALHIEVTGTVTASNLPMFKETALAVFKGINRDLQTDEDFANAEKTVKWCKDVEDRLVAAKDHALAQTQSIDELFRAIDTIKEEARATRLELETLVKARKESIRGEILQGAKSAYDAHLRALNDSLGKPLLGTATGTVPDGEFATVMKGKKTVKSLRDAVDQELARVKIASNEIAERVRANLKKLEELIGEHPRHLIHDWRDLIFKDAEAMEAIVKNRITEHEQAEQKRLEEDRERIRKEEKEKAEREAEAKLEAQRKADAAERNKPTQVAAEPAKQPEPVAAPASAVKPQTPAAEPRSWRTLREDLNEWRESNDIDDQAFNGLLAVLERHQALKAA